MYNVCTPEHTMYAPALIEAMAALYSLVHFFYYAPLIMSLSFDKVMNLNVPGCASPSNEASPPPTIC